MAEILVKAVDSTHADPLKDQRGCYKRGMDGGGACYGKGDELMPLYLAPYVVAGTDAEQFRQRGSDHQLTVDHAIVRANYA